MTSILLRGGNKSGERLRSYSIGSLIGRTLCEERIACEGSHDEHVVRWKQVFLLIARVGAETAVASAPFSRESKLPGTVKPIHQAGLPIVAAVPRLDLSSLLDSALFEHGAKALWSFDLGTCVGQTAIRSANLSNLMRPPSESS